MTPRSSFIRCALLQWISSASPPSDNPPNAMMSGGRLQAIQHTLASRCLPISTSILIRSFIPSPFPALTHSSYSGTPFSSHAYFTPLQIPATNLRDGRIRQGVIGIRMMGGGPRTFPGGVTKWQWKRMQEKKQRIREKAWLAREKLIYDRRRRAELMAAAPVLEKPWERLSRSPTVLPSDFDPRIKALADRFQKQGALDLWNEEDGPEQFNPPKNLAPGAHPLGLGQWRAKSGDESETPSIKEKNSIMMQDRMNINALKQSQRFKREVPESGNDISVGRQSTLNMRNNQSVEGRKQAGNARRTYQPLPVSERVMNPKQGSF